MSAAAKLAGFVLVLAAVFGIATVAGGAIDPDRGDSSAPAHGADMADAGAAGAEADGHGGHGASGETGETGDADAVRGLSVAQDGLQLDVLTPELPARQTDRLAFRIVGADGATVRDFDLEHERRMHVIVARRDLSGFQHVHPRMAADGTWSVPVRIDEPGSYRLFADFATGDEPYTLAADLRVDGDADLVPLPAPATDARSDGGDAVELSTTGRPLRAGLERTLRFSIERDGLPVELQRYLGAGGHLVALREGDLAFLHVHPTGPAPAASSGTPTAQPEPDHAHAPGEEHDDEADASGGESGAAADGGGNAAADDGGGNAAARGEVTFATTFPTPGRYRLFLQYKVDERVETVAFTVEVTR